MSPRSAVSGTFNRSVLNSGEMVTLSNTCSDTGSNSPSRLKSTQPSKNPFADALTTIGSRPPRTVADANVTPSSPASPSAAALGSPSSSSVIVAPNRTFGTNTWRAPLLPSRVGYVGSGASPKSKGAGRSMSNTTLNGSTFWLVCRALPARSRIPGTNTLLIPVMSSAPRTMTRFAGST